VHGLRLQRCRVGATNRLQRCRKQGGGSWFPFQFARRVEIEVSD
jgi:hypothetical protein